MAKPIAMEKSNCVVCGNSFAFRKGKLYCSDSCKTKAYEKKKAGEPITGEQMRPKGSSIFFDLAEHQNVMALLKDFRMPFDMYCFFRKNLPTQLAPEKISIVLDDYYQSDRFNADANEVHSHLQSAFSEFQKNFFAGNFEIVDSTIKAA